MILGNYDKIFEFATTFRDSANPAAQPEGAIVGMIQTTPYPVTPEAGAIINSRLPEISADLSKVGDFDPATLVMKVSGFGEVPPALLRKPASIHGRSTAVFASPSARSSSVGRTPPGKHRKHLFTGLSRSTAIPPIFPTASSIPNFRS